VFAHLALRAVARHDPVAFLAVVASPEGPEMLLALWEDVAGDCTHEPLAAATLDDFTVTPRRVAGHPTAIIGLPTPVAMTEAHLVAVMLLGERSDDEAPPAIRYLTLEHTLELPDRTPGTVLCEWQGEEGQLSHGNFGVGCDPQPEAFAALIEATLQEQESS
jgi:hypothetical protein